MSKRNATTELNHDNWDAQEEPEERGTFQRATPDVVEKRVIKAAKRRSIGISDTTEAKKSPFVGLQNFKLAPSSSTTSSPFSFLNHVKDNDISSSVSKKSDTTISSELLKNNAGASNVKAAFELTSEKAKDSDSNDKSADYYSKLKGLNESVSDWIKLHVNKNPFCILTPIFKDYEQYLQEIEKNHISSEASAKDTQNKFPTNWCKTETLGISSNTVVGKSNDNEKNKSNNVGTNSEVVDKAPMFTFGSNVKEVPSQFPSIFAKAHSRTDSETSSKTGGLSKKPAEASSIGSGKEANPLMVNPFVPSSTNKPSFFGASSSTPASVGFTFGSGSTSLSGSSNNNVNKPDDDDYQPPKASFTPVQEEGAAYSKRCKVFVRKDSSYQERGVGTLFLKPLEEKTQLIVRADTSLGNVLLNCLLTSTMSPQKMGSNNIMIICLPTPDSKPPPVPVLLKVKTAEDADEVLAKFKEFIDKKK